MKKSGYIFIFTMCMLMTACSSKYKEGEVRPEDMENADKSSESITPSVPDDQGTQAKDPTETEAGSISKQIKEQSFDVTLDGWGEVTFASFMPEENENKDGDVQFKLLDNGTEIYSFPGMSNDNRRFNQSFGGVLAVAFKDYNGDGKTDVITICEYAPQSGPDIDKGYYEVRLYTQKDGGKEFALDYGPMEYLMKNHESDSITAIMKGSAEYQEMMKEENGYYGEYHITACRGTAAAYAMSEEEIEETIGMTLDFQENRLAINGETIEIPQNGYEEEMYQTSRFNDDFRVKASDLGITGDEVLAVSILAEGNYFGNYFFVVDEKTLLIYHEGVFFEAIKTV